MQPSPYANQITTSSNIGGAPQAPVPPSTTGGNWFDSLLPTIGSVGGGIFGSVLGGPLGGIAGAGVGGALGKAGENAMTDQNPIQANDLTAGASGAVGQGLGEGALGLIGKGLGAFGSSSIAGQGADIATKMALKDQVMSHAIPSGIDPDSVVQTLLDNGVTDLRQAPKVFGELTGAANDTKDAGTLSQAQDNLVQQMERAGVKIRGDYSDDNSSKILSSGPGFESDTLKAHVLNNLDKEQAGAGLTTEALGGGKNVASLRTPNLDGANPTDVDKAIDNLQEYARQESSVPARMAYSKLANQMRQDLFANGEESGQLTPELKGDLISDIQGSIGQKYPKLAANMSKKIQGAVDGRDLGTAQSPLIEAIKVAESPTIKGAHIGTADMVKPGLGFMLGGPAGAAVGGAADVAMRNPAVLSALAGGAQAAPDVLAGAGKALTSPLALGAGGAAGAGVAGLGVNPPMGQGSGINNAGSNAMGNAGTTNNQLSAEQATETTPSDILAQVDAAFAANPDAAGAMLPVMQALTQKVASAQAAQNALNQYQQTLQGAGGSAGPLGGLLERIGGLVTGGPASQVGPQQKALESLLSQAGAPGVQVPGLYANPAGAQAGLGQAQSVLSALSAQ